MRDQHQPFVNPISQLQARSQSEIKLDLVHLGEQMAADKYNYDELQTGRGNAHRFVLLSG